MQFGPLRAVNDVSLALNGGDLLGLIGPNGAGKTTLLRSLAGIQSVTGGAVRVLGHDLASRNDEALQNLGFTPDTPVFYESLTVRDFLRFIAMGYGLGRNEADERISFWLEKVWLAEKAGQKIKALSRGMRQRVGLARTLLPNPAVVLLDEPAAGLDPAGRVQFRQLMTDLREQGKAIVIIVLAASAIVMGTVAEQETHFARMRTASLVRTALVTLAFLLSMRYLLGIVHRIRWRPRLVALGWLLLTWCVPLLRNSHGNPRPPTIPRPST